MPLPKTKKDIEKNKTLVNDDKHIIAQGNNGMIIDSGYFEKNPIITKIELEEGNTQITEIFINMVIINNLIIDGYEKDSLIPTFGIFSCKSKGDDFCLEKGEEKMFLVQQKIEGVTLKTMLKNSTFTLDDLQIVLGRIFSILIMLEKSPYKIAHHDLHAENIMLNPKKLTQIWLLDFGLSSFSVDGIRYNNEFEQEYDPENNVYHGGLYDLYFLMISINIHSINPNIKKFSANIIEKILNLFWKDINVPINSIKYTEYWLYIYLLNIERFKDKKVHQHNVEVFKNYSYENTISTFFRK